MEIERKYIDLKDLKVSEEGPGSVEGYRSVFGEIDEGGDIVLPGAFKDCLLEYLEAGFSVHSHDWKFTEAVGYPVETYEDDYGWFVKSEFHTTQTAQDARTIANERKKAGKKVGFSFGYIPLEYEYIDAKDFKEKLPLYVKADRLAFNLTKAQKFNRVRLLKKVDAPEDSLVLAGMNKLASATNVKSEKEPQDLPVDPPVDPPAGLTFEEHSQSVLAAVSELTERTKSILEIRKKEGRAISTNRRTRLSELLAGLTAVSADIESMLAETEPKPKEKEVDVDALKTQSLHARSIAMLALVTQQKEHVNGR